jgi:2-oxoisovalerate dehydrogenase E1 component beta subunit
MNMIQAINSAHDVMMEKDPTVVALGQDIGYFGGVFRCTDGLQKKYGEHRVIDAPIAEGGIVGSAIGLGINGLRPIAEIQFADYIYPGFDQIVSELSRLNFRTAGEFSSPVTIRTPCGGGIRGGQTHSQSPEGIFAHISGINIYNGPFDGDPNKPAVAWSSHPMGEVPEGYYNVPLSQAAIAEEGDELTIICYGTIVHVAQAAAKMAGVSAEIIDVRTLFPLDIDTLRQSVQKTGRCLVAHEATRFCGYGAELVATVQQECFWHLEAPIERVAGWDTPYPHAYEWKYFPGQKRMVAGIRKVMEAG